MTLGILAGRGDLVYSVIEHCKANQTPYYIVAFEDQTDPSLVEGQPHGWVNVAKVGAMIDMLRAQKVDRIVMAGHFNRPASWSSLKPDFKGAMLLAKIIGQPLGDDGLLRILVKFLEGEGFKVVGAEEIVGDQLLAPLGVLGKHNVDGPGERDIQRGLEVLELLGKADVGQAVVVQDGLILGVEAIEGTDGLIKRTAELKREGDAPVLVKMLKPGQETRVDRSVVGPQTIKNASQAGIRGVAVQAGGVILLNAQETISLADDLGLFIIGVAYTKEPVKE